MQQLRNVANRQCMDTMGHGPPSLMGMSYCHGFGNNQVMRRIIISGMQAS